jgi:hypothetical protein
MKIAGELVAVLALDDVDAARAAADDDAHLGLPGLDAGVRHRLARGEDRNPGDL